MEEEGEEEVGIKGDCSWGENESEDWVQLGAKGWETHAMFTDELPRQIWPHGGMEIVVQ